MEKYKNKHTGEIFELDHIESVVSHPNNITVYVFTNGERWEAELLFKHFTKIEEA